jgi:predicted metal-dependent peptidase
VQGKLPAGLERLLGDVLDPQVDWTDALPAWFARKIGSGSRSWSRPDRRLITRDIYCPGKTGYGCGTIVVGIDTSGSVWTTTETFLAEVAGILEDLRPKQLVIMWCDAKVDRVDFMESVEDIYALRGQPSPGGGGTDFRPVFKKIDELFLEPDGVIYLTDGYGTHLSHPPAYPTLWGSITPEGSVTYPFGDVIYIPQ